jgi:small GTP-binding protein
MKQKRKIKFKICLLGNPGVGKTSLIQKFVHDFFGDVYIRTMGTKVSRKNIQIKLEDGEVEYDITMMIWDIMGQKIPSVLHKTYFKFAKGSLIVCDVTRKNTLFDCEDWVKNLYEITEKIPIIFLANKSDLEDKLSFKENDLKEIAEKHDAPYYFTSAKTGANVSDAFNKLGRIMLDSALIEPPKKKTVSQDEPFRLVPENASQKPPEVKTHTVVKPGGSYLIKEEKPVKSFNIFKSVMEAGNKGLCITRTHPNMVLNDYKLKDVPCMWLTSSKTDANALAPTFLPKIVTVISEYIQENNNSIILLEGIEYLIDQNDFKSVLRMIHSINDAIMGSSSILLIPLDTQILDTKELHTLSRDLIAI